MKDENVWERYAKEEQKPTWSLLSVGLLLASGLTGGGLTDERVLLLLRW